MDGVTCTSETQSLSEEHPCCSPNFGLLWGLCPLSAMASLCGTLGYELVSDPVSGLGFVL